MRGAANPTSAVALIGQEGGTVFHVVPLAETEVDDEAAPPLPVNPAE